MAQQIHPAFTLLQSTPIHSLNMVIEEYQHKKTLAKHFHLATDNNENVFLVGLRTLPMDSTGVAHILEHTVLCGSERYPVRDPFFMMLRRSLQTFMNAFTSSDWTAYPFASQNRKDFSNLLDVYLDAVFFSRLDELDFLQEGHRIEFSEKDNPDSELVYKGVVYNEMKGAMSSPSSVLWQTLTKYLYPNTTYHYNSGGEPEHIPDLDYSQLKDFYQKHYHPSNAVFMTFGDIPAIEHHHVFEEKVLSRFERSVYKIEGKDEKRYFAPLKVEESYASSDADQNKAHIVLAWLLTESRSLDELMKMHLLSSVLLDNSASPLRQALESSELGSAPSPLCGLEDANREMAFVCGLEGSNADNAEAVEALIIEVLQDVAKNGVALEHLEAVLHNLELNQREIGGDSYPYGLQLMLEGLSAVIHNGDFSAVLNIDTVLEKLRKDIRNPVFIKDLVKTYLLDNVHQVRLCLRPDNHLQQRKEQYITQHLAALKATLQEQEKQEIIRLANALQQRQEEQDDMSVLPKVSLEDVPSNIHVPEGIKDKLSTMPLTCYQQGTNGLLYQQVVIDMPQLSTELQQLLPYYTACLTELGCGDKDYLQVQQWQAAISGGINAYTSFRGSIDDEQKNKGYFVLSSSALVRNSAQMNSLMQATLEKVRFDEKKRIQEIIAQKRARKERSITGSGHILAMSAATSKMSPVAMLSNQLSGLQGIASIKQLDERLSNSDDALDILAEQFQTIHQAILSAPRQLLLIGEKAQQAQYIEDMRTVWKVVPTTDNFTPLLLPTIRERVQQIWTTDTQVNFISKAYPTVPVEHPDAAALTVLGGFLRNGFLHRVIREQGGAYGGGASQDSNIAAFRFFSYRDPRYQDTLQDFDHAIDWLLSEKHSYQALEEAILGVISALDKPGSPAGEAKQAFHNALYQRDAAQRKRFRQGILQVSIEDLQRVGKDYFSSEKASIAIISNTSTIEQYGDLGLQHFAL